MKVSVCADMLFGDMPTAKAMELLKAAGADAVEFWGVDGKDLWTIAAASRSLGLPVAVFCGPPVSMIAPGQAAAYAEGLKALVPTCDTLGCRTLIACSGGANHGWAPNDMHDRLRATLEAAMPVLDAHDLTLILEPLNASEMSYLRTSREAFDLCRMLKSPRVKVLYDIYHMQLMEGNLTSTLLANLPLVGHLHVADVPGRRAPGTGEINYPNLLAAFARAGYAGYAGMEYWPADDKATELSRVVEMVKKAR